MTTDQSTLRCKCFHVLARHGLYGCRYCDCPIQPMPYEEAVQRVLAHLDVPSLDALEPTC